MKSLAVTTLILAFSFIVGGCTAERYSRYDRERQPKPDTLAMLKTQDVISMSKAGVSDSLIITMLDVSGSWFQLKPQDVIDLKNAGVSDRVINAMLESNAPANYGESSGGSAYAYPSYPYWYGWYYPYWYYPYWSYPSLYLRFGGRYYHPSYVHHAYPRAGYFGHYGGRAPASGGGRHR